MTYPFVAAPDHWDRNGKGVRAIAIHMAEGGGTVSWLTRDDGNSSHYVVEYTGRIVQMVKEDQAAGSINPKLLRTNDDVPFTLAGEVITYGVTAARAALRDWWSDPNAAVIAIEIEGFAANGPSATQRLALARLVTDIRTRHPGVPTLGHRDFQNYKACPGKHIAWGDFGGHGVISIGDEMGQLPIDRYGPWLVDIAVGKPFFDLTGKPMGTVSLAQKDHLAPGETDNITGSTMVVVGINTQGINQFVLFKPADLSNRRLLTLAAPAPAPGGFTQAQLDAAVTTAVAADRAKAKIVYS